MTCQSAWCWLLWLVCVGVTEAFSFPKSALNQTGPNSLVVVLVGFANSSNGVKYPACNETCVTNVLWGTGTGTGTAEKTVSTVFSLSSFGQFSFDQDVSAIVRAEIPVDVATGSCGMADSWFRAARTAVRAVNLTAYTARVYLYPAEAGAGTCVTSGFSNVGCTRAECNSWLRSFSGNLVVHELGHLANLSHAAFDANQDGVIDSSTESQEDDSDPMTTDGTWRGFSAASRLQARWMPCMGLPPNTTRMTLESLSAATDPLTSPIALCVVEPITRTLVVVSLRTRAGPDMDLAAPWTNAVYVHTLTQKGQGTARARLAAGDTYEYANTLTGLNITISVLGIDAAAHTAQISFEPCRYSLPLFSVVSTDTGPTIILRVQSTDVRCAQRGFVGKVVSFASPTPTNQLCVNVTLVLKKDNSPAEMSAVLVANGTGEILTAFKYSDAGPTMSRSVVYCSSDVRAGAVTVAVRDSEGDGFCCRWGPGGYAILVNGVVYKTGGEFAFEENTTIPVAPTWYVRGCVDVWMFLDGFITSFFITFCTSVYISGRSRL